MYWKRSAYVRGVSPGKSEVCSDMWAELLGAGSNYILLQGTLSSAFRVLTEPDHLSQSPWGQWTLITSIEHLCNAHVSVWMPGNVQPAKLLHQKDHYTQLLPLPPNHHSQRWLPLSPHSSYKLEWRDSEALSGVCQITELLGGVPVTWIHRYNSTFRSQTMQYATTKQARYQTVFI